jgi:bla regulator protein BlaR1
LLAHLLRHNAAKLRYALWLTASLKFLIPFALLTALGAHISLHHVAAAPRPLVVLIDKIAEPLVTPTISLGSQYRTRYGRRHRFRQCGTRSEAQG